MRSHEAWTLSVEYMFAANVFHRIGHCSLRNNRSACSGWQAEHTHQQKAIYGNDPVDDFFPFARIVGGIFIKSHNFCMRFSHRCHMEVSCLSVAFYSILLWLARIFMRVGYLWSAACAEYSIAFTSFRLTDERGCQVALFLCEPGTIIDVVFAGIGCVSYVPNGESTHSQTGKREH